MLEAKKRDYEKDAVILMRVTNIIRNKIFKSTHYRFTGKLTDEQYEDKTLSLLALVQMVLGGTNIQNQIKKQPCCENKNSRKEVTAPTTLYGLERET